MSNIDELIINAHLKERQPVELPWSKEAEKKVDETKTAKVRESKETKIFGNNETVSGTYENHDTVSKCSVDDPNAQMSNTRKQKSPYFRFIDHVHGYKPSLCDDSLSRNCRTTIEHENNVPNYSNCYSVDKRMHALNPEVTCSDTKAQEVPNKTRKSPRSSVKVSRQMIQESKLGYSVPLISGRRNSGTTENISKSADTRSKQETRGIFKLGSTAESKSVQTTDASNKLDYVLRHRNRDELKEHINNAKLRESKVKDKSHDCEIDNELDKLLDVTSDALQKPSDNFKAESNSRRDQSVNIMKRNDDVKAGLISCADSKFVNCEKKQKQRVNKIGKTSFECNENKKMDKYVKEKRGEVVEGMAEQCTDSYDESSEYLNEHRYDTGEKKVNNKENMDDILKFTCQMMEIKQQKLMSRKKQSHKRAPTEFAREDGAMNKQKVKSNREEVDHERIEELNKKGRELFKKKIRDRKKKRDIQTTVINVDPEFDRSRIRKIRLQASITKEKIFNANTINEDIKADERDDDVLDISPAKNREIFSDSDPDTSEHGKDDKTDHKNSTSTKSSLNENYRLNPSKSYTIMKHGPNTDIKDMIVRSKSILRGKRSIKKKGKVHIAKADNNVKRNMIGFTDGLKLETFRKEQKSKGSACGLKENLMTREVNEGKTARSLEDPDKKGDKIQNEKAQTSEEVSKIGEIEQTDRGNRPDVEIGDLMLDSYIDTYEDSDYSSGHDYFSRTPSMESFDLEKPRPASNRTYILDINSDNDVLTIRRNKLNSIADEKDINEDISDTSIYEIETNNYFKEKTIKKKDGRFRRFIKWLFCCVKPKTD